jgi:hypothetical protein
MNNLSRSEISYFAGAADARERQAVTQAQRAVHAELCRPLPRLPDPGTACLVLVPIRAAVKGMVRNCEVGERIELPRSEAQSQAGIGRVKIL